MAKKYHGKNTFSHIRPARDEERRILVETSPRNINFILKIVETHSHLALPVQIDPSRGLLAFHTSKDQEKLLLDVLTGIPRPLVILPTFEEKDI